MGAEPFASGTFRRITPGKVLIGVAVAMGVWGVVVAVADPYLRDLFWAVVNLVVVAASIFMPVVVIVGVVIAVIVVVVRGGGRRG